MKRISKYMGVAGLLVGSYFAFMHPQQVEVNQRYQGRSGVIEPGSYIGIFDPKCRNTRNGAPEARINITRFVNGGVAYDTLGNPLEVDGVKYRVEATRFGRFSDPVAREIKPSSLDSYIKE
ncbi:MAG: hypothetical protein ACMXYF_01770 [Candidatus Woesearchaeota archaeon]